MRHYLHVGVDGVLMCGDQIVVPESLRPSILSFLYSTHQGVTGMAARAQGIVYWPGLLKDIQQCRAECVTCCRNAPSQPSLPPQNSQIPKYTF